MPVKVTSTANTAGTKTGTKTTTKYNPKLGSGFSNDKFGEGSILVSIDADGLNAAMNNLQVGSTILLRYNKVTTKGNKHYFAEILPPMGAKSTTVKTGATSELD